MGKNLKGKEIGEGISQRANGRYYARFRSITGKRQGKYFDKVSEAKAWIVEQRYQDAHGNIAISNDITVDAWFQYWMENIKKPTIRHSTQVTYSTRYRKRVKPYIGRRLLADIRPLHCQDIINKAQETDAHSSVAWVMLVMGQMFKSAVENKLISSSPMTASVKQKKAEYIERRVLTAKEQDFFVEYLSEHHYKFANIFLFVLETGLRCGEVTGLKWEDVDFNERTISIKRSVDYQSDVKDFVENPPKTKAGYRTIPLTTTAYNILKEQKSNKSKVEDIRYHSFVFVYDGKLAYRSSLDKTLKRLCVKSGLEHFSMHTLRHSFATRCIERGMRPKTLQKILGHSSLQMTMDLYVHVTDDAIKEEMEKFERGCIVGA